MKDTITFVVNNWAVIIGLILFAYKVLRDYGVIKSDKLDKLYEEAVAFGEQLKKNGGKDITNEGIKSEVYDYINKRTSPFYKVDEDKIEAVLNLSKKVKL